MKLYRHYKNKLYKFVGLARHSETLEEMVIYEALYDNAHGKVWVRPREMFFESLSIDGQTTSRFQRVPFEIETRTHVSDADIELLAPLIEKCFGEWDADWFHSTFQSRKKFFLGLALVDSQVIGFKLGYENGKREFYSWLGAVLPEYRGLGVASELMQAQHEWCRRQGYEKVLTKTQNCYREMLCLNLKNGFEIIGTHASDRGGLKIMLEKKLST